MFSYVDFRSYFNYYFDACGSDPFHFFEQRWPEKLGCDSLVFILNQFSVSADRIKMLAYRVLL